MRSILPELKIVTRNMVKGDIKEYGKGRHQGI